jgi:prepilin-type N-terminal cleavage/methylation domain-containing protein/prepilin-type processing-associated H-X9-DG protein
MVGHDRRKTAFTLVELLAVIGILSVLVSLLVPSLSAAKSITRSTDCMCNIRSLAQAAQMYACEWDSYPPAWVVGNPVSIAWCGGYYKQGGVAYMDVTMSPLWPYLQQKQMLWCKEFTPPQVKYTGSGQISGYGINCQYVAGDPVVNPNDGQAGMSSWARPALASQIAQPAGTILFADCARVKQNAINEEVFIYPLFKYNSTAKNYATIHFRHRGKASAAFCDGHADSISPLKLDPAGDGTCGWMANEAMDRD